MRKRWYFPKKKENLFSSRRWTDPTSWRRSRTVNIHLDTASTISRRKSRWFSCRIRRVSSTTSRLISWCWWSDKWLLVHVRKLLIPPSRWTKSQTLLAERRIIPYSTEIHWRIQNYSYKFGCQARATHRWLLEYRWVKRFVWFLDRFHSVYSIGRKTSRRIYVVRSEIDEKTADIQARLFIAKNNTSFLIKFSTRVFYQRQVNYHLDNNLKKEAFQRDPQSFLAISWISCISIRTWSRWWSLYLDVRTCAQRFLLSYDASRVLSIQKELVDLSQ